MDKFISFGKINKQYKYILIHVLVRLISDYIFSEAFPNQIRPEIFEINNYPPAILVQIFFNYLGASLFSIVLLFYENSQTKKNKKIKDKKGEPENKSDIFHQYELIYYIYKPNIKIKSIILITFLSITSFQIVNILIGAGFWSLLYWIFDLFFVSYMNFLIFGIPIYSHKKCAMYFVIIFCLVFKFLSTLEYISNDEYNLFYKNHIFLIPIIVIAYFFITLIRFYSLCKIKWFLDYKFIPFRIYFVFYNFIGTIIFLIASIISSFVKCVDKERIKDIDLICLIKMDNGYYFDSFSYFFEQLWRKNRNIGMNILYLFLFLIRVFLNAVRLLYYILIIRHLTPEYYLCAYQLYYIINKFISLIKAIINDGNIKLEIYDILTEIGNSIGILIYLELIELKFGDLNYNLKKHIELRSISEYSLNNLDNEEDNENIQ